MLFWTGSQKTTRTPRPNIPDNQKVVSDEWNALTTLINGNYQEFLDSLGLTVVEFNTPLTITERGIYLFTGGIQQNVTINDGIVGRIELRTVATVSMNLIGNIAPQHTGTIYEGTPATVLLWSSNQGYYTF